jgi:hypothetical protein
MRSGMKWLRIALPGCVLLQVGACTVDPQYFLTSIAADWIAATIVNTLFNLFMGAGTV